MSRYLLQHRHEHEECGVFASFNGHQSQLRHQLTLAPCRSRVHPIGWTVEADTEKGALRPLPPYVAARTTVACVNEVEIR
jgi:hypothetical protein